MFVSTIMMASIYLESPGGGGSANPHNNLMRDIALLSHSTDEEIEVP